MNKDKNVRNKIISLIVSVLLVASVFVCLFVVIQVLSNGYVSIGGYSFFKVVTGSMEPEIPVGALILSEETEMNDIEIGEVVCFRSKSPDMLGKIITHRVIEIIEAEDGTLQLVTKGDANLSLDGYYVTAQNLIGKVIWQSGSGKFSGVLNFLSNKFGFLSCIAFPALLILTLILRDNVKTMQQDIKRISEQLETRETASGRNTPANGTQAEDYEQMRERIRAELIEELNQIDKSEQPKQQ
ncbi:MAG: signal peptidase I [Clostridia bacterium]|nr:signal peptidase I [Clostridia bacterium]